jgi:hypothetical protein
VAKLIFTHGVGVINLVSEDKERNLGEVLHGEKSVKLGLGFGEAFVVFGIDEEDDTADFGEIILPEATGYGDIPLEAFFGIPVIK